MARHRRNRRGDMFMLGLDVLFLIAIILIFWKLSAAFKIENPNEGIGTRQSATLATYAVSERMLLYLDEAAKFAAYEALATLPENGGLTASSSNACNVYAGYNRWTSPTRDPCFPSVISGGDAKGTVYEDYKREVAANLRRFLSYPGMPNAMSYDITLQNTGTLHVIGTTQDSITLPIITGEDLQAIVGLITSKNLASVTTHGFTPDATLPNINVVQSGNRKERSGSIKYVVILSTRTQDAAVAIKGYNDGLSSVHYLIGRDGGITQLVPEYQRAMFMPSCDENGKQACTMDIEDEAISIALVNVGKMDYKGTSETLGHPCVGYDPNLYEEGSERAFCEANKASYASKDVPVTCSGVEYKTIYCWQGYTKEQLAALKDLVVDIARKDRRDISIGNIYLFEELRPVTDSSDPALRADTLALGPALHGDGSATGPKDEVLWYPFFKQQVVAAVNAAGVKTEESEGKTPIASSDTKTGTVPMVASHQQSASGTPQSSDNAGFQSLPAGLPMDGAIITSCFGERGKDEWHDAVDLVPGGGGDDTIYAIADGVVEQTCALWTSACACSTLRSPTPTITQACVKNCNGKCGNYGNYVIIHHTPNELYSRYDHLAEIYVKSGQAIKLGQPIGKMGNTGRSDGAHLDFKIYTNVADVYRKDQGKNPLCFFPEAELTRLRATGSNCAKYRGSAISRSNPVLLQECSGLPVLSSTPGCNLGTFTVDESVSKALADAKAFIEKQNLASVIADAAKKNSIDERILIAQMAAEGTGTSGIWTAGAIETRAEKLAMAHDAFSGKTDAWYFALASYKEGTQQNVKSIVDAAGKDPQWTTVEPKLSAETQKYARNAIGAYVLQGGTTSTAYSTTKCDSYDVKELGTYTFTPSFSVEVPDTLSAMQKVVEFAQAAYKECDGSKDTDVKACLDAHEKDFSTKTGMNIVTCEDQNWSMIHDFEQAYADCETNQQDGCACAWRPPKDFPFDINISIFDDNERFTIDGQQMQVAPSTQSASYAQDVQSLKSGGVKDVLLNLQYLSASKATAIVVGKSVMEGDNAMEVYNSPLSMPSGFVMYKATKDSIVWLGSANGVQMCGPYKTTYPICVQYKQAIPRLSTGKFVNPTTKFALYLKDTFPPNAPGAVSAVSTDKGLQVSYTKSSSPDVAYYEVGCKTHLPDWKQAVFGVPETADIALPPDFVRAIPTASDPNPSVTLLTCDKELVKGSSTYDVVIYPFDMHGNRGGRATGQSIQQQSTTA